MRIALDAWTIGALASTAAAISSIAPVCAQSDFAQNGLSMATLDEVVVTADRMNSYSADFVQAGSFRGARQLDTPMTVNVVTEEMIQSQQDSSLLDALRNTAGVSPVQTSITVYDNIAIRGVNVDNRSNYRLDGILPIVNLVDLPLEDKERVEALKGASALYYGFTTPSGIVNLTMKRATPAPYLAATLFGNGYGALGAHIDAGNTWGPWGVRVNALYGSVDSGIDSTYGHRSLLATALDFKPTEAFILSLDAEQIRKLVNEPGVFQYIKLPVSTPENMYPSLQLPPLLNPAINFGPTWALNRAEEWNLLTIASWKWSRAWALSVSYGTSHLERDRHFSTLDLDTYGPNTNGEGLLSIDLQPGSTNDNSNYRAEVAGAFNVWITKHQLEMGASENVLDSFSAEIQPATCPGPTPSSPRVTCAQNAFDPVPIPVTSFSAPTGPKTGINDIGYYVFDRMAVGNWLQVLAGARKTDYIESDLNTHQITFQSKPTAISYGAVVKPQPWVSIYGTYIDGLESTPPAPFHASNYGATLPATDSTQREAGVKLEPQPGLLLQAAYFDLERGSAFVNAANLYVLDGRARYRGAELSATGEVTADWSVYATGQILDAKEVSGADTLITTNPITGAVTVVPTVVGRTIENAPARTFSLASEYRFPGQARGFSVNGAVYHLSRRAVNMLDQAFIPGYTLLDLGAAWAGIFSGHPLTLRVNAQNVADTRYFSSTGENIIAQGPPRMIKFAVTTEF
jgi:iron complex outermembrane recepter protein